MRGRQVRTAVERHDAGVVDHLVEDHDVIAASGGSARSCCTAPDSIGGPALNSRQRSPSDRSSGPSAGCCAPRLGARSRAPGRRRSAPESGRPADRRSATCASCRSPARRGRRGPTRTRCRRCATSASAFARGCRGCCAASSAPRRSASSSVRNSLPANSAGRSSGVIVEKFQTPCRSGCPSVRALCGERRGRRGASASRQRGGQPHTPAEVRLSPPRTEVRLKPDDYTHGVLQRCLVVVSAFSGPCLEPDDEADAHRARHRGMEVDVVDAVSGSPFRRDVK